ncbi:MAG: serine/threonine-protein kinase [Ruminococcus sp.]|jgi:serine/threonine protein kinase|nr:serine/threonine-protein kinase [Ruminococcus sp.]
MELAAGRVLTTVKSKTVTVISKIGEGGQGAVYNCEYDGQVMALKWYHKNILKNPEAFLENLKANVESGAPDNRFLWPVDITNDYNGVFGYIMPLIPIQYKSFSSFLLAKTRFATLTAMIDAALNIISGFRELHKKGYSYQDINDGNFFINPENGDVLICDNDNIAPYGENLGIAGKCRYMAPEVVMGQKLPDVQTDKYSLSVILFMLTYMNHPLEGKVTMPPCMTEELEQRFFAEKPIFIFDKHNDSNRPVRGVHQNVLQRYPLFPAILHDNFEYAFSPAVMKNELPRLLEKQWQEIYKKVKTMIIPCGSCGYETFYDVEDRGNRCINCKTPLMLPVSLKTPICEIPVYPGKYIYEYEISEEGSVSKLIGVVTKGSKNPNLWGLRNLSEESWTTTDPEGNVTVRIKNEVTRIRPGVLINFGDCEGEIVDTANLFNFNY